jgi:hypothetical protein
MLREAEAGFDRKMSELASVVEGAVQQLMAPTQARIQRIAAHYAETIRPNVAGWLEQNGPAVVAGLQRLQRFAGESQIPNWEGLETGQWLQALEMMRRDDGVPLTWVPPREVVVAILEADNHAARNAVLLEHSEAITDASLAALEDVIHPGLASLRAGVQQGWSAYAAGLWVPAQAVAASAVSGVLNRWNYSKFGQFRKAFEPLREQEIDAWGLIAVR